MEALGCYGFDPPCLVQTSGACRYPRNHKLPHRSVGILPHTPCHRFPDGWSCRLGETPPFLAQRDASNISIARTGPPSIHVVLGAILYMLLYVYRQENRLRVWDVRHLAGLGYRVPLAIPRPFVLSLLLDRIVARAQRSKQSFFSLPLSQRPDNDKLSRSRHCTRDEGRSHWRIPATRPRLSHSTVYLSPTDPTSIKRDHKGDYC
jgi:hypothetical protein